MGGVELLPLPEWAVDGTVADDDLPQRIQDYARANVAHATAAKDAEIEALRAEAVKLRNLRADAIHECALANVRAERLAEALRGLVAYVRETAHHNTPSAAAARAALEQEAK